MLDKGMGEGWWCKGRGHSKDCVVLAFHMSNDLLMGGQREWIICSAPLCVGGARDEEDVGEGGGEESMRYLVNAIVCTILVGILRRI